MNKAICTVYRAFFRYNRQLQAAGQKLEIRTPLDKEAYRTASYAWVVNESASRQDLVELVLPNILEGQSSQLVLTPCCCTGQLLDQAFGALRTLSEQMHMQDCSSDSVTDGIRINVTSAYIGKVPVSTVATKNLFTYRVRVTNVGDNKAKLMGRQWIIQDDKGKVVDQVAGPGVVGNTPLLKPYDCFQYYSSAMLESMQGAMHGSFQMLRTDSASQQEFDANIQPFRLIASSHTSHSVTASPAIDISMIADDHD
ncbi:hypothetical protein WJX79_011127 [Trebouxia sp. C0005]